MPLVIGGLAPHGFPIIPDLSKDAEGGLKTREAMLELGRRFHAADLDVLVIAGPHGVRVNGFISIADCGRGAGTLHYDGKTIELNVPMDLPFTDAVQGLADERDVPVVGIGYGGSNRVQSVLPLDWGIMTPLWFAGYQTNMVGAGHPLAGMFETLTEVEGPSLVVANPSRRLPFQANVDFGRILGEVARDDERRVGIIASCDWGHRHDPNGPNGFHPDSPKLDAEVVEAIKTDKVLNLMNLDAQYIANAAIDGLWQLLMLEGARQVVPMDVDFLTYEAPTYYGMMVATYAPG